VRRHPELPIYYHRCQTKYFNFKSKEPSFQKAFHQKDDLKEGASKKKTLARLAIQNPLIRSMKISKKQSLSDAIVGLFKSHPLPFTLIESTHFQALFKIVDTNLPIANCLTLASRILDQGNEMQEKIKKLLSSDEVLDIHLSTDLWHSLGEGAPNHYIAVIISFVDQRFEFNEILLTFSEFNVQHNAANLANSIFSLLGEYQILKELTDVTTDGAVNNFSRMHELERLMKNTNLTAEKIRSLD
jgi:hypothetical protein